MYPPKDLKRLPSYATGQGASAILPRTLRHRGLAETAEANDLASVLRLPEAGTTMADAALAYARLGVPVFPCSPNGKEPLVGESAPGKGDGGVYRATTASTQLRAWWEKWPLAMIGAPMGKASGFVLVDLDPGPGQDAGELLEQLRDRLGGKLAFGLVAHTPRGGMHLFYAMPTDATIGNRANLLKAGKGRGKIDIRGDGGYAIFAPSQRRGAKARQDGCDGGFYRWNDVEGPGEDFALPSLPQTLINLIAGPYEPELAKSQAPMTSSAKRLGGAGERERRYALRALENETRKLGQQIEGERNNALDLAGMKLAQLVATGALSEVLVRAGAAAGPVGHFEAGSRRLSRAQKGA
jgi:putative DNA primase/helicase